MYEKKIKIKKRVEVLLSIEILSTHRQTRINPFETLSTNLRTEFLLTFYYFIILPFEYVKIGVEERRQANSVRRKISELIKI